MQGFIDFIRTQGVIGLAVGLLLGASVSELVKSIIDSFVNPILGLILGSATGLKSAVFTFAGATFTYGAFLSTFINFLVVAFIVYYGVKRLDLDKIDKPKA